MEQVGTIQTMSCKETFFLENVEMFFTFYLLLLEYDRRYTNNVNRAEIYSIMIFVFEFIFYIFVLIR